MLCLTQSHYGDRANELRAEKKHDKRLVIEIRLSLARWPGAYRARGSSTQPKLRSWKAIGLAVFSFALMMVEAHAQTTDSDTELLFTGYLLGYYRVPERQTVDFQGSCEQNRDGVMTPSDELLERIRRMRNPHSVLVGMGDNFAVELGSRTYGTSDDLTAKTRDPGSRGWPDYILPGAIGDSVGCFVSLVGYEAIVPGKNDFYFGPDRLRRIAHRLASVPRDFKLPFPDRVLNPVHMLGANLVVKTDSWVKQAPLPPSEQRFHFKLGMPTGVDAVSIGDNATVLPFLRKLRLRVKQGSLDPFVNLPYLCKESDAGHPGSIDPNRCNHLLVSEPHRVQELSGPYGTAQGYTMEYRLPTLYAGVNYGLCLDDVVPYPHEPHCTRFYVARPFFLSPRCRWDKVDQCSPTEYDEPYVIKKVGNKLVVIFGVIDPDMKSLIGRDNLSWENTAHHQDFKTQVDILDPRPALEQALQLFDEANPNPQGKVYKVLLAQMSRGKAEELATHFGFDVVIAEAEDYERTTINEMVLLHPDKTPSRENPFRAFIAAPWKGYNASSKTLVNPLRKLDLWDQRFPNLCADCRTLVLEGDHDDKIEANETATEDMIAMKYGTLAQGLLNKGASCNQTSTPDEDNIARCEDLFRTATLRLMQQETHADIACLQKRDFYWGPFQEGHGIERILWMGNYLQVLSVKGATLKSVLAQSDNFDQLDLQSTQQNEELGRGLVTFGIEKALDGDYLVDGVQLDPTRLYTVATSNHIIAGDTGYPDLFDAQLADVKLPAPPQKGEFDNRRISTVVCKGLARPNDCVEGRGLIFASTQEQPSEAAPSTWQRIGAWGFKSFGRPNLPTDQKTTSPESLALDHPDWRLSLRELSLNFSATRNNLNEVQRVTELAGVSEQGANAAKGHSIDFSSHADWERRARFMDEFVRTQLEYKVTSTASTTAIGSNNTIVSAPPNVSVSKNRAVIDAGFFWHAFTTHKYYPKLGFILQPFRFDTQLVENALEVKAHFDPSTVTETQPSFKLPLERTRNFLARGGLRAENAESHVEVGVESGWQVNALQSLIFNTGTCGLEAGSANTLTSCLSSQKVPFDPATIRQNRNTRSLKATYADFDWTVPLPSKFSVELQDEGELFGPANGDNSTDTLYRNDAILKTSLPIFANLKLEPGIERFDYENKENHIHLGTWAPILKLTFNFDKYSGGKWGKSIRYQPLPSNSGQ
jgi:2',3'-cyclic-nucleotide 2'-phosphodiesterase (5'-nucleotidase family)